MCRKQKRRWVKAIKDFHRRNRGRTGYVGAIDHRLWYLRIYDHFWHRRRLLMTGFSIQKARFSLYLKFDKEISQQFLDRIGKYKAGVSCVYVNKLADIDEGVLREFIREGYQYMQSHFKTIDRI